MSPEALAPLDAFASGGVLDADCNATLGRWRRRALRSPFPLQQHRFNEQPQRYPWFFGAVST